MMVRDFMDTVQTRRQAHELIDRMTIEQVAAVVGMLEAMLDPFERAMANAPFDDEPVDEEEEREVAAARALIAHGDGIPHEEVLAEYGLTSEDWKRMGETPLEPHAMAK